MAMKRTLDSSPVIGAAFNQDGSGFAVGTATGYSVYNTKPCKAHFSDECGSVAIVQMIFNSSTIVLVGADEDQAPLCPTRILVKSMKRNTLISELSFPEPILYVRVNRQRLVVGFERNLIVYDATELKMIDEVETGSNPNAVCALSTDNSIIAFPSADDTKPNEITLYDSITKSVLKNLEVSTAAVAHVSFNITGTLLATTSEMGTHIRVWNVDSGEEVNNFRRGTGAAQVTCIVFDEDSSHIAATSVNGTIHIFKIQTYDKGMFGGFIEAVAPAAVADAYSAERGFIQVHLEKTGVANICSLSAQAGEVYVLTEDGDYFTYTVDFEAGGEGVLVDSMNLFGTGDGGDGGGDGDVAAVAPAEAAS